MFARTVNFVKRTIKSAVKNVTGFVRGVFDHAEAVTILGLSAFGANMAIGELPFYATLPAWIEASMVVPVLSVLLIVMLTKLADIRHPSYAPISSSEFPY